MKFIAAILMLFALNAQADLLTESVVGVFDNQTGRLYGLSNGSSPATAVQTLLNSRTTKAALYVDCNYTTGGDGSQSSPFNTVQAAINAATAGMSIYLAPCTYTENVVMRDLDKVAIFGSAEQNTTIVNATAGHTFSWIAGASTGASVTEFCMQDISLANTDTTGTYLALNIDGNAVVSPNTFLSSEADFNFVDIDGDGTPGHVVAQFRNAGFVYYTHGSITGDFSITNVSQFAGRQIEVGSLLAPQNLVLQYDATNAVNGLGRSNYTFGQQSVVYGGLSLLGHPIIQLDKTALIVGNTTGTLTSFYSSGRDYCPTLIMYNQFGIVGGSGGNITLTLPNPQASGSAFNFVDLSDSHFPNASAITFTKSAFTPATSRGYGIVQGDGAAFGTSTITANGYVAVDLRGSSFTQANIVATGSATFDRDKHVLPAISTASTPTAVTITPPFPSTATYGLSIDPSTNTSTWYSSKSATGFSINLGTAGGTVDAVLIRQ